MSEIIINESAAQNDIRNLENAKNTLKDAASAVTKLMNTSAQMQGQTGAAIQTKASQIASKLEELSANLAGAQNAIRAAVAEKQEQDARAAQINRSGGV